MLDNYKEVVISDYHEKKVNGLLSLNLSHPTPAKLREESLIVLHSRPNETDKKIIRDFFNSGVISDDYSPIIRRFDVDKLRPLVKFLKGQIEDTEPKNIEILAWLIDSQDRPYKFGRKYQPRQSPNPPERTPLPPSNPPRILRLLGKEYVIDIFIFLITTIGGIGLAMRNAEIDKNTTAYICTSKVAKRYHLDAKCHGLNRCGNIERRRIDSMTITEARKLNRTLCEIERQPQLSTFFVSRIYDLNR